MSLGSTPPGQSILFVHSFVRLIWCWLGYSSSHLSLSAPAPHADKRPAGFYNMLTCPPWQEKTLYRQLEDLTRYSEDSAISVLSVLSDKCIVSTFPNCQKVNDTAMDNAFKLENTSTSEHSISSVALNTSASQDENFSVPKHAENSLRVMDDYLQRQQLTDVTIIAG